MDASFPPSCRQSFAEYPEKVPALEGGELEIGVLELIDYLTQKRYELLMAVGGDMKGDDPTTSKSRTLMQIIDTTLLKVSGLAKGIDAAVACFA